MLARPTRIGQRPGRFELPVSVSHLRIRLVAVVGVDHAPARRSGGGWHSVSALTGVKGLDRLLVGVEDTSNFGFPSVEPVLRPDATEPPAQAFQVLLAEPVTVSGGL